MIWVVVPVVVDVETLVVKVADIDAVALRVANCSLPSEAPNLEVYRWFAPAYILLVLNFIREGLPFGSISARNEQEVKSPSLLARYLDP